MKAVFAPHLDDELIGCYSILDRVDTVVFFHEDYRAHQLGDRSDVTPATWRHAGQFDFDRLAQDDLVYVPSRFDLHPFHREVRTTALRLPCQVHFYSVEMNVPWLELEEEPDRKRSLFEQWYPQEKMIDDKYWLFRSIKPFDEYIWAVVRFELERYHRWSSAPEDVGFLRHLHRHLFKIEVRVQQFGDDRDIEYFTFQRWVRTVAREWKWSESTSCEMFARALKRAVESQYSGRLVEVAVFEDGENGCVLR